MIDIFDTNITADESKEFFYKVGRVETTSVWRRPTFLTTQNLLIDIKNNSNIFEKYTVYLMGGITWDFTTTWDIDIVLCSETYSALELEDDIDFINNLALNNHNLLTDPQWKREPLQPLSYTYLINNNNSRYESEFVKIGYAQKRMNGYEKIIDITQKTITRGGREVVKLTDYLLLYKNGIQIRSDKIINKLKNTVNQEARFDFLAENFINYDENYFNLIKNRYSVS